MSTGRTVRPQARRVLLPLLVLIVAAPPLAVSACTTSGRQDAAHSASAGAASPAVPIGSSAQAIAVDGRQRTYRIYRPAGLAQPAPLVIMLHGALGSGAQAESSYGWDREADSGHFMVVYPDGYKRTWAVSDGCCGPAAAQHVDDVAFIRAVVARVSAQLPIDRARIYATGISNGGMLAYRLACATTIFAAIAPDSATMLNACPSPAPISVMHVHGTADRTIPYTGGPGRRNNGGTGAYPADTTGPPIPDLINRWRQVDGCAPPASSRHGAITTSVSDCPDGRAVVLVAIAGAGHQWPGQPGPSGPFASRLDPPYRGWDATAAVWQFFAAHGTDR
ncbi:MAG: alpha/beta hydrolase family esterase [Betaproteobacteria bacterium]